jgi:hypothetical protein
MPLDFPTSPTNGQTYNGYVFSSSVGAWQAKPAAQSPFYTSDTPPSNPVDGDSWFNTNDGTMYIYVNDGNTSQWVEHRSEIARSQVGLVPIVPTSVAVGSGTGTVNSAGLMTFSGASSVSLNGVFTSSYTNYKIIISGLSSPAGTYPSINAYFRASGTNVSSGYYVWGLTSRNAAGIVQQGGSNTSAWAMASQIGASAYSSATMEIQSPAIAKITTGNMTAGGFDSGTAVYTANHMFLNNANVYDGFSIVATANNVSGEIKIYGYN